MVEGLEHRLLFASISTGTDSIGKVITFTGGDAAVYRLHLAVTNHSLGICGPPTEQEPNDQTENAASIDLPASGVEADVP